MKKQNIRPFSGHQEYNKTKSNRKFIRITSIYIFSVFLLPNLRIMRLKLLLYIDDVERKSLI